jgi:hypothetical protein
VIRSSEGTSRCVATAGSHQKRRISNTTRVEYAYFGWGEVEGHLTPDRSRDAGRASQRGGEHDHDSVAELFANVDVQARLETRITPVAPRLASESKPPIVATTTRTIGRAVRFLPGVLPMVDR